MTSKLPRVLGPWMAAAVVVGTVIGSGVFKKAKNVAIDCPEFGLALSVWVLGGLLALFGALTIAEVAVRIPKAGGNYAFLRDSYGRWAGFLWGWVDFGIIRTSSIGVLAVMFVESLNDLLMQTVDVSFERWLRVVATLFTIATLTALNIRGTRIGGRLQLVLTLFKVGSLLAIIALPIAILVFVSHPVNVPTTANMTPFWPSDFSQINWSKYGQAAVAVQWAYHGWLNITPVAEEVTDPQRNIPRALIGGVLLLIALYVGANVAYYTVISQTEMMELGTTPVSTAFCVRLLGNVGGAIASLILMTSVFGSLNGNILVAPRLLYAMSDDGMAPKRLRELHPKFRTPAAAMVVFSGWAMLLVVAAEIARESGLISAKKSVFDILTDYCVVGATAFETMGVAAIFILRRTQRELTPTLPYRCPGYPVVPIVYVLILFAILMNMFIGETQRTEAIVGVGFVAIGAMVYAAFLQKKPDKFRSPG